MKEKFEKAYKGSWYTITGCGGDLQGWKDGYSNSLKQIGVGVPTEWIDFTGKDMNEVYGLTGRNAYPENIHFLAFSLEGLNIGKLAMFRLRMQDRWFDDIVDNNARREEENNQ